MIVIEWRVRVPLSARVDLLVIIDEFSCLFRGSVFIIAASVVLFSVSYIKIEKYFLRFHILILLFVGSIGLLIFSPNLIRLLLGWDGLGVTSFLLVIYFQRNKSFNAGMITVLTNRLGDVFILLRIRLRIMFGSWSVFVVSLDKDFRLMYIIVLLLVLAAFTKRAQLPFSAWLPAAIAAPTPVSALVHSSTLVTAGVYILIRLTNLIEVSNLLPLVLVVGCLTITIAGVSALIELDIKKIIALSTLSQLGLMICSLGLGLWKLSFLHLLSHAYFKALLFIRVGNIIHLSDDYQDMRKVSLSVFRAMTLRYRIVANISLCGLPFLRGFYTKDLIVESRLRISFNLVIQVMLVISIFLTSCYSFRFLINCWVSFKRGNSCLWEIDRDVLIMIRSCFLWLLSLFGGFLLTYFRSSNFEICLSTGLKNLALWIILLGGISAIWLNKKIIFSRASLINWSWGSLWGLAHISRNIFSFVLLNLRKIGRICDLSWAHESAIIFFTLNKLSYFDRRIVRFIRFGGFIFMWFSFGVFFIF
jgi:NADH-ubiquinone oxidoreductase chain 5